ncbi:MAG TPA: glycosyl hydrolase family 65 protein [Phycisphaerae bacterium]|nr:glycosyl hydrolase family 65 protein [Phycisphaerae bacterium]
MKTPNLYLVVAGLMLSVSPGIGFAQFPEPASKSGDGRTVGRVFDGYELQRFSLTPGDADLSRRCRPATYFDAVGNRSYICGTEDGPYEAWIWPLQVLVGGSLSFRPADKLDFFELHRYAHTIESAPDHTTIRYLQAEIAVNATFVTPDDEPVILILLAVNIDKPGTLAFSFTPRLAPQWPASLGGVAAQWDGDLRAFRISEPSARFAAIVGSPHAVRGSQGIQYLLPNAPMRLEIDVDPDQCRKAFIPLVFTAADGAAAPQRAASDYQRVVQGARGIVERHHASWREKLTEMTRITTPDKQLDQAFLRNAVSLSQSLVRSEALGDGLVAGYGPAGPTSQRPGFAWFFTGDVSLNAPAYLAAGLHNHLAVGLRFAARHQRTDGKIPHEVVLSAHLCDWFKAYPFAYIHGDTTGLWIHACRSYVDATGDRAFLDEIWPAMLKGYRWILAQDEDGDGLPDNTRAGMGASEIGVLLNDLRTDILLASVSAAAFRDVAELAARRNENALADEARGHAERAAKRIADGFWDPQAKILAHCLRTDGTLSRERTAWPAVPIMLALVDGAIADPTLDYIDSDAITTPWGCRLLSRESPHFNPMGYNQGAVWPFITGLVAYADFERGRADAGYAKVSSVVELTFAEALGRVPELLSGTRQRSLDAAVPNQMFSAMTTVGPVVRGMLGLRPRVLDNTLELMPCFPAGWEEVRVENFKFGDTRLHLKIRRRQETYEVDCTYEPRDGAEPPRIALSPRNGKAGRVTTTPGARQNELEDNDQIP